MITFYAVFAVLAVVATNHFRLKRIEDKVDGIERAASPKTLNFPGRDGAAVLIYCLAIASTANAQTVEDAPAVLSSLLPSSPLTSSPSAEPVTAPPLQAMALSPEVRAWYRNPDGSCVQCSIGMVGCHCNDQNAACLLWDTAFGPAVRGGSNPSRVESYCDRRGIKAQSVTGLTVDETLPWMEWAARTGRFAAIGAGTQHFQTLYGFDPTAREWYVCNNNSTGRVDRYSDKQFRELHAASGPWCVILEKPSSPPPEIIAWWK